MLSKLLRHEFRATGRIMFPVYMMMAASAILFNLFIRLADNYDAWPLQVFQVISGILFFVTLFGAGVVTLCLMVYRFYKNYMTDEGYLMFTLPVTTAQLIWAKLIVALVWNAVTLLAMAASVFLGTVGQPFWKEVLPELSGMLGPWLDTISTGNVVAYIAEGAALLVLSSLSSYLMFYAAIAMGHSVPNHKILCSVGFYIVFNIALQTISSFVSIFGIVAVENSDFFAREPDPLALSHWLSLGTILASAVIGTVFYLLTYFTLKKRLNLQ